MKKKLMAIALAVCVVAVLAAGASLAYFTDKTDAANNTFTMGNVKIALDETDLTKDDDSRTAEGNTYENLYPGMEMVKDPTVHNTGRNDAWVRVIVRVANGAAFMDQFKTATDAANAEDATNATYASPLEALTHGLGNGWSIDASAPDGNDMVYTIVYNTVLKPGESTPAVFEKLYIPATFGNGEMAAITYKNAQDESVNGFTMSIHAEAIQSEGLNATSCQDAFTHYRAD